MPCLGDSKRTRAANVPACGALLLLSVSALLLISLPGCAHPPGSASGAVEVDLISGDKATGHLFSGQTLRATAFLDAGHIYDLRASLVISLAGTELGDLEGAASGGALAGPVQIAIGPPGSEPANSLIAQADGTVIIEIVFPDSAGDPPVGDALEAIRRLISGPNRATYELLLTDFGFDDRGTSPEDASTLVVGPDGDETGTLTPGDEADYFVLPLIADLTYQLNLESTGSIALTSGSMDRFGEVNFGVPSTGGVSIAITATAGIPGAFEFTAGAEEQIFLRLVPAAADSAAGVTIQYAIGVVEIAVEEIPEEPPPPA